MKTLFGLLAPLILAAGCATPLSKISTQPLPARELPVSKIEIDNFARDQAFESGVYKSGWWPIPDKWLEPPFHEAFAARLRGTLKAAGKGPDLQLAVIDSGFYMETKAAEDVPFVGLVTTFRERPYRCAVVLNIKTGGRSERREFEHLQTASRAYGDLEDKAGFINQCQAALINKVAEYLSKAS